MTFRFRYRHQAKLCKNIQTYTELAVVQPLTVQLQGKLLGVVQRFPNRCYRDLLHAVLSALCFGGEGGNFLGGLFPAALRFGGLRLGEALELTLREFELLKYLAERENKVFSREQLLEEVWGYEYYGDIRTVDVTVRRLREKLEDDSSEPKYIMTKRGIGYYFRRP